jgi:hypothetical protein
MTRESAIRAAPSPAVRAIPALAASMAAILALTLLGGCSFFSHSVTWTKSGVNEGQAQSDLAQCTDEAKSQTDIDQGITTDIQTTNNTGSAGIDTSPIQNMQSYQHERRFKSVLADCMAQLGYSKVE